LFISICITETEPIQHLLTRDANLFPFLFLELKFRRTSRGDWHDGNNWNGNDSLLNSEAIPHVERVPCQYDSVEFPTESSFHLFISSDVVVHKFFLGEEVGSCFLCTIFSFHFCPFPFFSSSVFLCGHSSPTGRSFSLSPQRSVHPSVALN